MKIVGYEILSLLCIYLLISAYDHALRQMEPFDKIVPLTQEINDMTAKEGTLPEMTPELEGKMNTITESVKEYFTSLASLTALAFAIYLAISGISRWLIYTSALNQRFKWRLFGRFMLYNSGWITFWIALSMLLIMSMPPTAFVWILPILILLYLHNTCIFRYLVICNKPLWRGLLDLGLKGVLAFVPVALMISAAVLAYIVVVLVLFRILSYLVATYIPVLDTVVGVMLILTAVVSFFVLVVWARGFYLQTIKEAKP